MVSVRFGSDRKSAGKGTHLPEREDGLVHSRPARRGIGVQDAKQLELLVQSVQGALEGVQELVEGVYHLLLHRVPNSLARARCTFLLGHRVTRSGIDPRPSRFAVGLCRESRRTSSKGRWLRCLRCSRTAAGGGCRPLFGARSRSTTRVGSRGKARKERPAVIDLFSIFKCAMPLLKEMGQKLRREGEKGVYDQFFVSSDASSTRLYARLQMGVRFLGETRKILA